MEDINTYINEIFKVLVQKKKGNRISVYSPHIKIRHRRVYSSAKKLVLRSNKILSIKSLK